MTGETQLRARRTRIKILKAIADKNGAAGFSDIKHSTGLSTGSIYYHLERMGNYVSKNSKYYTITEEGLQLLREVDPKYAEAAPPKNTEEQAQSKGASTSEETITRPRYLGVRHYVFLGVVLTAIAFATVGLLTDWQAFFLNAGVIASIASIATIVASFLMIRYSYHAIRYRGMMLSISALTVLLAGLFVFSGIHFTGASPAQPYDNSMDALLSSYSLHWQIR
ncbi:MAG: winged helix-turn-helix domain-containing protein [Thermoproteota archaeon]|nr:winged helix-turn-helix domain-containing protein [Thermoproteota archaeon]